MDMNGDGFISMLTVVASIWATVLDKFERGGKTEIK